VGKTIARDADTLCLAPRRDEATGDSRRAWIQRLTRFAGHLRALTATIPVWGSTIPYTRCGGIARDEETAVDFAAEHASASRAFTDER